MAQDIWINLPVKDVARAASFFSAIGFTPKPGPGNSAHSASFSIGKQEVVLMLFAQEMFTGFSGNALADTDKGTEVLFSLGADSCEQVDALAARVSAAGGEVFRAPAHANGFMYGCGFCDPDGHRWNALYMDMSKLPA